MANIKENNRHNLKLKINYDEFWDFHINNDRYYGSYNPNKELYDKCLMTYIDFSDELCFSKNDGSNLYSLPQYVWSSGISTDYKLYNVGYTNVDNGHILYEKHKITNKDFKEISTGSTYEFHEDDLRLHLHQVSSNTSAHTYDIDFSEDFPKFKGGFYQGIFKTECDKYQILPSVLDDCWGFEFTLKKEKYDDLKNSTLNEEFGNEGIFFYIGTRSSNKWAELYNDENMMSEATDPELIDNFSAVTWAYEDECDNTATSSYDGNTIALNPTDDIFLEDEPFEPIIDDDIADIGWMFDSTDTNDDNCAESTYDPNSGKEGYDSCLFTLLDNELPMYEGDYNENDIKIEDFDFSTFEYGVPLSSSTRYDRILTDNKFLLFHRGCDGYRVDNWIEDDNPMIEYIIPKNRFVGNLFLYMDRTCTGYTVETIDSLYAKEKESYDIYKDLYNNALAFIINEDGSIGYKYYTYDCDISGDNKTYIMEGKSFPYLIENDKWYTIHVKVLKKNDKMKLMFYVNGKLKYVTKEMPLIDLRKLAEDDEKQEMVAYNISIGGGTQGLSEVVYYNYMKQYNISHNLEQEFCGSFNGKICSFRWFGCELEQVNILQNYLYELNRLKN